MLLEFTVENYRSIKEPVTLSAVAQKSRKSVVGKKRDRFKTDDEICPGFAVEGWDFKVLPVMAIFGANASGKSNVLRALEELLSSMSVSLREREIEIKITGQQIQCIPFKLDAAYRSSPTKFTLKVVASSVVYEYHIAFLSQKVISESLKYSPADTKRLRLIFSREWKAEKSYVWKKGEELAENYLKLGKTLREDEIFINLLRRFEIPTLQSFFQWLASSLASLRLLSEPLNLGRINKICAVLIQSSSDDFPDLKDDVIDILKKFDTGLLDLDIRGYAKNDIQLYVLHQDDQGEKIYWKFEEESAGTQALFSFALWMITILKFGGQLLIDEFGNNLHPKITSYAIQLFQNPKTNPKGAQLIFTSHDNTIQRNQLLRRDQIWFTEKKPDQSTDLYSLAEFKVRNDLAIDKAYLDGRFGAVPFLPETVEELLGVE